MTLLRIRGTVSGFAKYNIGRCDLLNSVNAILSPRSSLFGFFFILFRSFYGSMFAAKGKKNASSWKMHSFK